MAKSLGEIKKMDKDQKVQALVDLAFEKGVNEAVKTAQKLHDPYILDAFHDILVDRLYDQLIKNK